MICYWRELLDLLPPWLREPADTGEQDKHLREIRLRVGQTPQFITGAGERYPTCRRIGPEDLAFTVNLVSRFSPYAAIGMAKGYLTARGGHRVGLCGTAVVQNGKITAIKELNSLCVRVARDMPGLASSLVGRLGSGSVLLLGPPGSGKTTLLRDLIRQISEFRRQTISVVDERGEIFPVVSGRHQFQTGSRTDVLTGCGKQEGMELVLRAMGPAWIAVDEITCLEDCTVMEQCGCCGAQFLATAHAGGLEDLHRRPVYKRLLATGMFTEAVVLRPDQTFTMERLDAS